MDSAVSPLTGTFQIWALCVWDLSDPSTAGTLPKQPPSFVVFFLPALPGIGSDTSHTSV